MCEVARLALGASPALGQGPGSEVCLACEACAGPGAAHAMQPEHTSVLSCACGPVSVCVESGKVRAGHPTYTGQRRRRDDERRASLPFSRSFF